MRDGWTEMTLGDMAEVNPETTKGMPPQQHIRYIDLSAVSADSGIDESAVIDYELRSAPGRARRVVRHGDVLVSTVRPYLRGFAVVPESLDGAVASTGFTVLRARKELSLPGFVWSIVSKADFADRLMERATGSNYPAVRPNDIAEQVVLLPPLVVQRRTVDLIDRIDTYALRARTCWGAARSIRSALLDDLLFPRGDERWATTTVGDVVRLVKRGRAPAYADDGLVVLSQKCVREENTLELGAARCTDADKRPIPDWAYVTVGDTLVASTGRGTLGRASYVAALPFDATVDSHVTIVRPESELVLPAYLGLVLSAMRSELEAYGSGSTNQTELSREAISSISIPLPPGSVQHDIVNLIDAFDSAIRPISSIVEALTSVRSSMLDELLSGEREIPPSYDELVGLVM